MGSSEQDQTGLKSLLIPMADLWTRPEPRWNLRSAPVRNRTEGFLTRFACSASADPEQAHDLTPRPKVQGFCPPRTPGQEQTGPESHDRRSRDQVMNTRSVFRVRIGSQHDRRSSWLLALPQPSQLSVYERTVSVRPCWAAFLLRNNF
jgi:hypothetical protein